MNQHLVHFVVKHFHKMKFSQSCDISPFFFLKCNLRDKRCKKYKAVTVNTFAMYRKEENYER